ncbi:Long-chain-fatty-acid--[acyl-carrier-protein] ligase [Zostera marina]|uniref:4-coumarate--CoA ligase n=1 Tax=Zostera marina TaxID=29655 RepID=A0A0K9NUB0_ZOSMR|nr:Long-chain-fatty-acid--[acyl-carrier-protein] ligase [Zostera marina]
MAITLRISNPMANPANLYNLSKFSLFGSAIPPLGHFPCRLKLRFDHPRTVRVSCCSPQFHTPKVRKCCPSLESAMLPNVKHSNSSDWKAVPDIWKTASERYGDRVAVVDPYHNPPSEFTYKQLEQEILCFSEGLRVIGVNPEDKLALFADNSCRWLIADQGIMATGAINVVRGSKSPIEVLLQIYTHSESKALVVDNPDFFNKLTEDFIKKANVQFVVLLWDDKSSLNITEGQNMPIYNYLEIIDMGKKSRSSLLSSSKNENYTYEEIRSDDVGAIIYTSGTTGSPKGVMLTHGNFLHQIKNLWNFVPAQPGDRFLSVLPPWHVYERACEYFIFSNGAEQVYTNIKRLKEDLVQYQPQYLISVPLIYETLHSAIMKQLSSSSAVRKFVALNLIKLSLLYMEMKNISKGMILAKMKKHNSSILDSLEWFWARAVSTILWPIHRLANMLVYKKIRSAIAISKAGISGGGSLPDHIDKFFEAIGIVVQNGYGLTETSPVVSARKSTCNVLGTVGHPLKHTEIKIVDLKTSQVVPDGTHGIIKVRGPQVMKGYYKNPSATLNVLDEEGWFDTGDIGWIAPKNATGRSRLCGGMVVIVGRSKDTIVLSTGENVEPSELEEAALRSTLIQQIVVLGQDQRRLCALIVPNKDELLLASKELSTVTSDSSDLKMNIVNKLMRDELTKWTSECSFQIGPFLIIDEAFTVDNGLMTPTMKVRRDKITNLYSDQIAEIYR